MSDQVDEIIGKEEFLVLMLFTLIIPLVGTTFGVVGFVIGGVLYLLCMLIAFTLGSARARNFITTVVATNDDSTDDQTTTDPITSLQEQYAMGKLSEEEFEDKLDTLIQSQREVDDEELQTKELELESSTQD